MATSSNTSERTRSLISAFNNRILVIDGAMGTALQGKNLTAQDFGGEALEGCNENLILTRPDVILDIHRDYLRSGCDIVETNTFGATPLVLDEYGLGHKAHEINVLSAQIARKAAEEFSTAEQPRFVAGSIGPTTKAISVTGGVTFAELEENFYVQAKGLIEGGVDYLLLETCQDTRNIKAALLGIERSFTDTAQRLPIAISVTIEAMGTMLAGQNVDALLASLLHLDLLYVGLNCATGPEFMTDPIRSLAKLSPFRVSCVPNAGLPDENGCYLETPSMVASVLKRFLENGWLNLVGGCCGTHAGHISELAALVRGFKPRVPAPPLRSVLSGVDALEITDEMRPVIVGERTNVIGSRKFKDLICQGKFDEASDIARAQIKSGAQIIDACLANPDRDELTDMSQFLEFAIRKIRAPLMIDSTDAAVIERSLTYCQGKAIINSINLEDGEERFEQVVPLARRYGAALVVGTIDDDPAQGMGVTRKRKLEIAERSYQLLTEKYGVQPEDIYWDPLVFPCATGDEQYIGSALETIEGIRLIKARFPRTRTILGISNVSFGLPPSGREVLNSVFLYHCVQAGLDLAIVNSEKLERYASIPAEEKLLAEDLLFNRIEKGDPIAAFAAHFRGRTTAPAKSRVKNDLPLDQRISRYIVEGSKDGLTADLEIALQTSKPLDIVNGPLMAGMDEVGRLFNTNQLIVAEVLQSAEAMKAAVSFLEPFMEKSDTASRGKILLATVKGDVHDIGKNLVEIILSNNGFEVVNLGIKVPPEQLLLAVREHSPDMVGLSGLLVKSAHQMVITAGDLAKAGISTPILVGGAALSENFVDLNISGAYPDGVVAYAKDAMTGLDLAKKVMEPALFATLRNEIDERRQKKLAARASAPVVAAQPVSTKRSSTLSRLGEIPAPQDLDRHVLKNTPLEQIWKFINPLMLYGRHLGIKGSSVRLLEKAAQGDYTAKKELESRDLKSLAIWREVEDLKKDYAQTDILRPSAIFQFFRARAGTANDLQIFAPDGTSLLETFHFPRQKKADGLCLSDFVWGRDDSASPSAPKDAVAFFVTTVGRGVREMAENLKNNGDYLKSHILQALALETAEAYAELLHSKIRGIWGFSDAPEMTMMERFQAKYRGKRYSFGYPACPRLDDQAKLWTLLKPNEIGVDLTEGFMMDPESSVSAVVFHHPEASYFSVGQGEDNENRG